MVHGGVKYPPSVFVVDSHVTRPPLPPRLTQDQHQQHQYQPQYQYQQQQQQQQRSRPAQTLLFLLVFLALSGMVIEACFIYRLYQNNMVNSEASFAKSSGDKGTGEDIIPTTWHGLIDPPSKPVAHLTDGLDVVHKDNILRWSTIAQPILYKLDYTDGQLVIQTEGYYYVYSKVCYEDKLKFVHSIHVKTNMYAGKSIPLLESRSYSGKSNRIQSNSYLGGVFHFYKDDAIFVKVNNISQVVRNRAYENLFGVVMI
ncbi:tumor necrosis factor ligand superfamily member 14 [Sphaeramia orbicularis]|uniref:Tumor necrosis factor ligand superfamily member 14-like n=1 Tax=Sphaeramia orbicularis TaxID=375764 RepID=A0A672ZGM0_9TELE|nr:tumor necrosis factor ligand superfamily member 14-like [Sphaeramia orbicularis]XP_029997659.1 tumor necrosis factor ligand superfamily member 14-like [Sphaeramia orbicularis]